MAGAVREGGPRELKRIPIREGVVLERAAGLLDGPPSVRGGGTVVWGPLQDEKGQDQVSDTIVSRRLTSV